MNLAENARARFDYDILETYEAGISLAGHEVKSVKKGHMGLTGSYGLLQRSELWLVNASIPPYQPNNVPKDYDSHRSRRLLVHRPELRLFAGKLKDKSFALLPLRAYLKGNIIKLELGLGKSRKKADKREYIQKRQVDRELRKEL